MKKERSINELLKLMLDHQECFNNGLCGWISTMYCIGLITYSERSILRAYIYTNKPVTLHMIFSINYDFYYWTQGRLSPRIKWLQKHIKLTNKQ